MSQIYKPAINQFAFSHEWIQERMLFIAGPRQVGKTTYTLNKIKELGGSYFNWDDKKIREAYLKESSFFVKSSKENLLVVFDEIHKRKKWKDILKGIYDTHKSNYRFIITGSAKLDTFRRSGDSLVGRYFLTHLFPISSGELLKNKFSEFTSAKTLLKHAQDIKKTINDKDFDLLLKLGGFPEPFFSGSESLWRRWQKQHQELLIREDLRDLSNIQNLDSIENLVTLLNPRISSTVSYNSLSKDLEVDHKSIKQWLLQLERIMLTFTVKPWSKRIQNSLRKNPKIYFYDWSFVKDPGARFENFIACNLLKAITLWNDRYGYNFELYFIRTYSNEEIDFCITLDSKPWLLIEVKNGYPSVTSHVIELSEFLKIPSLIITNEPNWNTQKDNVYILNTKKFLSVLP